MSPTTEQIKEDITFVEMYGSMSEEWQHKPENCIRHDQAIKNIREALESEEQLPRISR